MKLFRMKSMTMFGLGFLAGSRAGRGPWEKAQESMEQLKGKVNGGSMGSTNSGPLTSTNGMDTSQRGNQGSPALTEM